MGLHPGDGDGSPNAERLRRAAAARTFGGKLVARGDLGAEDVAQAFDENGAR